MIGGMHGAELVREPEAEGLWTHFVEDFEETKELFREFLQGSSRVEELGFDEHFHSGLEIRWSGAFVVRETLVAFLSFTDVFLELFVESVEICNVLASKSGGHVAFRVDGEVGMVTFVGKEWRYASSRVRSIVVSEFR
jgi:hypothetical protein